MTRASELERWDKKYVWHPFTQMKDWLGGPVVVIERGEGNTLVDTRGRRYLDGVSSLWCNVHGHRVPEIDAAVKKQLGKVAHSTFLGLSNVPAIRLSKKLLAVAPKGLTKVFYADSGSACVEVALKMAFQYWRAKGRPAKKGFLKLRNAYHGDTLGSVSVGGIPLFHDIFHPLLFKTFTVDAPYRYRDSFEGSEPAYARHCAAKAEAVLKKHHSEIAAMIVEPVVQGAAGMLTQPKGYLAALRRLTKKYGVLLIVDEVATGFGRTGKMFACEHERVTPDFLCVAKGITAGYLPLSAVLTTDEVYRAFLGEYAEFKAFFHGHTYTANPLAAAAAVANLDLFRKRRVLRNLQPKIRRLREELIGIWHLDHVGSVRQAGFMAGIELVQDKKTKKPYPLAEKRGIRVCLEARKRGVMLRPLGNVLVIMPPLSFTEAEIKKLCRVVRECIKEVTE
ncbi:MAG TPA: adenosylmethionine--8-amino-7-oxononanoate transaminase [Candidatus Eisenbacteria bacterium]|nr:adenosylmethionine--8-amino-7-oxononanoate transaminase [Candidatus Eisenbacteria bacterium]